MGTCKTCRLSDSLATHRFPQPTSPIGAYSNLNTVCDSTNRTRLYFNHRLPCSYVLLITYYGSPPSKHPALLLPVVFSSSQYTVEESKSKLRYVAYSARDYGTVFCWAANVVASQHDPCAFTLQPAGGLFKRSILVAVCSLMVLLDRQRA